MFTYVHIYMYIYIYIHICMYLYIYIYGTPMSIENIVGEKGGLTGYYMWCTSLMMGFMGVYPLTLTLLESIYSSKNW